MISLPVYRLVHASIHHFGIVLSLDSRVLVSRFSDHPQPFVRAAHIFRQSMPLVRFRRFRLMVQIQMVKIQLTEIRAASWRGTTAIHGQSLQAEFAHPSRFSFRLGDLANGSGVGANASHRNRLADGVNLSRTSDHEANTMPSRTPTACRRTFCEVGTACATFCQKRGAEDSVEFVSSNGSEDNGDGRETCRH
jgi:hypothetical protein